MNMTMNFTEHRFTSADGLSLYFREYGGGPEVVLCVHGLTRNSKDFHELALRLADRYRVLCPDVRGRGQSQYDPHPRNYHPIRYAQDMWLLLEVAAVDRCSMIGTSMGGLIGMIMASQHPERLLGLVMNDIGPEIPLPAMHRIMSYAGRISDLEDWEHAALRAQAIYHQALPGMSLDFWRQHVRRNFRENESGQPVPDMDPAIGEVLRNPPRSFRWIQWLNRRGWLKKVGGVNIDPWEWFRAVEVPCLLLQGELSDVLPDELVVRMQEAKPHMQVVKVANRGHTPLLDEPECRVAIESFLQAIHGTSTI